MWHGCKNWLSLIVCLLLPQLALAERIKDLAEVAGVRSNQLVGYGLVVGLNGTGDQTTQATFTAQTFATMLQQFGIQVPPGTVLQLKNVAAVALSAELPPFAKRGQTIDVTVSSIGNAKSLRGGTLLMAPLKGADGQVYAVSQGNVVVSGFGAEGSDGSKITVNVPSVGRIPGGASVERTVASPFGEGNTIIFNLHRSDFTTAKNLAQVINQHLKQQSAFALDASSVQVRMPQDISARVGLMSELENLQVTAGDAAARVIINSRTGTVVIGEHVRVLPAIVSHGNLTVTITETPEVSQPTPFSNGETKKVVSSDVQISQGSGRAFLFQPGSSLQDIVHAINQVGAAPGDLVAILEALKTVGALKAELVVI